MWFYSKNNEQQGPVEAEQIREMQRNGDLSNSTLVWKEGMAQWTPLSEVLELREPVPTGTADGDSSPKEETQGAVGQSAQPAPLQPQLVPPIQQNTLALVSMILGICGMVTCGITSFVAVPLGHIARKQIRNSAVPQSGGGMALAGLITGYIGAIGLLLYIVAVVVMVVIAGASGTP